MRNTVQELKILKSKLSLINSEANRTFDIAEVNSKLCQLAFQVQMRSELLHTAHIKDQ